jgi:hypothetical protein
LTEVQTTDERRVAKQIVSYFLRNQKAADTLEGIARWRLLEEQIHQTVRITEQALRSLVAMGLVVTERTATAGIVYHLNEIRRSEAEEFVTHGSPFIPRRERRRRSRERK